MHASAAQPAGCFARGSVRTRWLARLLVAASVGVWGIVLPAITHAPSIARSTPGPSFELTDHNGEPFSSTALAGKPYAVFFGFTHCPDVCPTTLLEVGNLLHALGDDAGRLRMVFVTVDPERDTPAQLRQYLGSFDPRIVGLTGSEQQIAAVAKGWGAFHNKIPEGDGTYTIVHSAYIYLMDRNNRLADTMGFQETEAEQLAKLRPLIGSSR
jgi:protein SCO1/2